VKVLFDQGTPAPLKVFLPNHDVLTAYELVPVKFVTSHQLYQYNVTNVVDSARLAGIISTKQRPTINATR
jgi:hypothetical protein